MKDFITRIIGEKYRRKLLLLMVLFTSFTIALGSYFNQDTEQNNTKKHKNISLITTQPADNKQYICPMHSHIVSDKADNCPICGMKLVLNKSAMKMPAAKNTKKQHEHTNMHAREYPEVIISPTIKHNLGIRTTLAKRGDLSHNIETIGKITRVDPMARRRITSPINGKIVDIVDKYEGDKIKQGEFMFSVASEELFNLESEFQRTYTAGDKASSSAIIPKLAAMGVDAGQLEKLQNGVEAKLPAKIYAQENGYVFTRRGEPGDKVTSAFTVFNLGGNYQVIEVTVEIFERQWDLVKEGQSATMQLRNLPGKTFQGKVERVDEPVGYTTRALETRIKFKTDHKGLTQSTFARVIIKGKSTHNVIVVPRDAVIRTAQGNRIITVDKHNHFKPVGVTTGDESDGYVEIVSGIRAGDKLVVSGQFLIDSESSLLADLNRMGETEEHLLDIQDTSTKDKTKLSMTASRTPKLSSAVNTNK